MVTRVASSDHFYIGGVQEAQIYLNEGSQRDFTSKQGFSLRSLVQGLNKQQVNKAITEVCLIACVPAHT